MMAIAWVAVISLTSCGKDDAPQHSLVVAHITGQTDAFGTLAGTGTYEEGAKATVTALPKEGYLFVGWVTTDNAKATPISTATSYSFEVMQDATLYGVFKAKQSENVKIDAKAVTGQENYGTAIGSKMHGVDDEVTLEATPAEGYTFIKWVAEDNVDADAVSTANPWTFKAEVSATYYAVFEQGTPDPGTQFTVTATVADGQAGMGRVTGDGTYTENTNIKLEAIPLSERYEFDKWVYDGISTTVNPLPVKVTQDITYVAYFKEKSTPDPTVMFTIDAKVDDSQADMGRVSGSGQYAKGAMVTLQAISKDAGKYEFWKWKDGKGNEYSANPLVFSATEDLSYTAVFREKGVAEVTIETRYVSGQGIAFGTLSGGGKYALNAQALLMAKPAEGYKFDGWYANEAGTGNAVSVDSNYSFTVTGDQIFYAKFKPLDKPAPSPGGTIDDWGKGDERRGQGN
jgi:uncharacterized repeat protein (TIGR02543 family)